MTTETTKDLRFQTLDLEAFKRSATRLTEVGQADRILTEAEITTARERIMPKILEAIDAYLNKRSGAAPSPTEYAAMRSKAWSYSAALVLAWRDSRNGMRPMQVDRAAKELGEVIGGLTPTLAELRDLESEVEAGERRLAALERDRESQAREEQRQAAFAELAARFKERHGVTVVEVPSEG